MRLLHHHPPPVIGWVPAACCATAGGLPLWSRALDDAALNQSMRTLASARVRVGLEGRDNREMASRDGRGGSNKGFWGGMFRTRERFSLEELTYLYETLVKHPVVTDSNKVRSIHLAVHLKSCAIQDTQRLRTLGLCEPRRWARDAG